MKRKQVVTLGSQSSRTRVAVADRELENLLRRASDFLRKTRPTSQLAGKAVNKSSGRKPGERRRNFGRG
jgi:hypothetical protein